ncbi:nucleotidyltransferase family protein [Candidatus Pacearchaeota archaeon]|nr:nucleotidyltransferase family protein [Candidatus Pacearchaeota archaeon]
MKCVILCAGYATRLYPLTLNKPKALLPIKGKPLLEYIVDKLEEINDIDEIYVVSNDKFYNNFVEWKNSRKFKKKIDILNDHTLENGSRLGGIGDLWYAVEQKKINDDLFVLAGDLFFDFNLKEMVDFFHNKDKNVIGLYDLKNLEKAKNFGILELENNKIVSFLEKPKNPKSTLISTAMYIYSKEEIKNIENYMKTDKPKEGPGYLIPYFMSFQDVYGFVFKGSWEDIGSKEVYNKLK